MFARVHPAIVCAVVAVALYLPSLGHGFVWDDHLLVEGGLAWASEGGLPRMLISDFWAPIGHAAGYWRPAITLSYWLDGLLFGVRPAGFHATNVAVHAAAAVFLALLLIELKASRRAAALAGIYFATLPSSVECVSWISGRADLFAGAGILLSFWRDRSARRAGRTMPGFGAVAAFALALLCKESAALMVVAILIAEWIRRPAPGSGLRGTLRWLAPYLAVTIVYLVVHAWLVPPAAAPAYLDPARIERTRWAAWTILPRSLAFLWPGFLHSGGLALPLPAHAGEPAIVLAIAFQVAFLAVILVLLARRSRAALPLAMLAIPIAPLTLGTLLRGDPLYAERFFYLPAAGVAMGLALALDRWSSASRPGRVVAGGIGVLALLGAIETVRIEGFWHDDAILFQSMSARAPGTARNHVGWAEALLRQGRPDEAKREYLIADSVQAGLPSVALGQGYIEYARQNWDRALAFADQALVSDTLDLPGRLLRASSLLRLSRIEEAGRTLSPLITVRVRSAGLEALWGEYLLDSGRDGEAVGYLSRAAERMPGDPSLPFRLGLAEARLARPGEARAAFERALALDPRMYGAWLALAIACQELGDVAARERALERAAALPQASDGGVERLRRRFAEAKPAAPGPGSRR